MKRYVSAVTAVVLFIAPGAGATAASIVAAATPAPVKCAIPKPCALFTNTSSGPALHGSGASGSGLEGASSSADGMYGTSAAGAFPAAGVEGESTNLTGSDVAGMFGATYLTAGTAPGYGVVGYGSSYGVVGEATSDGFSSGSFGVFGQDATGHADDNPDDNVGVVGASTVGTGIAGLSNGTPVVSVFGESPVGVYGVAQTASGSINPNAFAFFGETNSFGLDIHNTVSGATAFVLAPSDLVYASANSGNFYVDYGGNEHLSGTLTTAKGGPYVRATGSSGAALREYGARSTAPTVEDVGEAALVDGRAYVPVDARFSDVLDRRVAYHVFVTPEGDCNGLYVTQKSAAGFAVRELRGGRSSLAFEYRIVAKPLDEDGARLAAMPREAPMPSDGVSLKARSHIPVPLSPQERLKRRIGVERYAQEMTALRERQTATP